MARLALKLSQQQKLSPQQIQLVKLLQIPSAELAARIEEELEENPALEEGSELPESQDSEMEHTRIEDLEQEEWNAGEYLQDDYAGYKMAGDAYDTEEPRERVVVAMPSPEEFLMMQMRFVVQNEREQIIAQQLIGSLEDDGYLRRSLESIVNDLAFTIGFVCDLKEVEAVLKKVQQLDPAGIAARDLQECLSLQLHRKHHGDLDTERAIAIIDQYFDDFSKKHYETLMQRLGMEEEELKAAIRQITACNPKPGGTELGHAAPFLQPDFIIEKNGEHLEVKLNQDNAPELRVSKSFQSLLETYDEGARHQEVKEAVRFIKHKLDAAQWFIQAIKQRQSTLLRTMESMLQFQYEFFMTGDEGKLKPMKMKDIAQDIGMDVSTISRVVSAKSLQCEHGIFPLKYFFTEGISHESGAEVSIRQVQQMIRQLIQEEPSDQPYPDEQLEELLHDQGFIIKRRTIAKYREQMGIPVARMRRKL